MNFRNYILKNISNKYFYINLKYILLLAISMNIVPTSVWYFSYPVWQPWKEFFSSIFPISCIFILVLILFKNNIKLIIITTIIYSIIGSINSVHCIIYELPFSSESFTGIFASNKIEIFEFIKNYLGIKIIFIFIISFTIPLYGLYIFIHYIKCNNHNNNFCAYYMILIISIFICVVRGYSKFFKFDPCVHIYKEYKLYKNHINDISILPKISEHTILTYGLTHPKSDIHTIIVVIGESASRRHHGIYGYIRDTTPCIKNRLSELILFKNASSPSCFTVYSHSKMLQIPVPKSKPSLPLIGMLKSCGIETWWITTQYAYGPRYSPLPFSADHMISINYGHKSKLLYDEELLPILLKSLSSSSYKVIFINLMGSHFGYHSRYPKKYDFFYNKKGITAKFADSSNINEINAYDNSIRYTDFLLDKIIFYAERYKKTAVIYLSDHGQDVYDVHNHASHCTNDPIGIEIPFWIWLPKDFRNRHQKCFELWKKYENINFCSDNLGFIIADMLGININDIARCKNPFYNCNFNN